MLARRRGCADVSTVDVWLPGDCEAFVLPSSVGQLVPAFGSRVWAAMTPRVGYEPLRELVLVANLPSGQWAAAAITCAPARTGGCWTVGGGYGGYRFFDRAWQHRRSLTALTPERFDQVTDLFDALVHAPRLREGWGHMTVTAARVTYALCAGADAERARQELTLLGLANLPFYRGFHLRQARP